MPRPLRSAAAAALVLLGACSSAPDEQVATEPIVAEDGVVALTGTDRLRWSAEEVQADTGELTFELSCGDAVNHNLVIDGEEVAVCRPGDTGTGTASLVSGDHEFVCTVPGHQRTMRGTITVA